MPLFRPLSRWTQPVTIVVLSKYRNIFDEFARNIDKYASHYRKVLVMDGLDADAPMNFPGDWLPLHGPAKFSMAGNANQGWRAVQESHDILYIGDDCKFTSRDDVKNLYDLAYSDTAIGLLSPKIIGGADNPLQTNPPNADLVYTNRSLALVCTYIKRAVINKVGYLDEKTFPGTYGWEDYDFCRRVVSAGFKMAVTPRVEVIHGIERGPLDDRKMGKGTETFFRNLDWDESKLNEQIESNKQAYFQKWGDTKVEF